MAYGFDFLPFMQAIGTLTLISLAIYLVNVKRDFSWVWMWLVILPIYFIIGEFRKGGLGDIFFNLPWTVETTVMVTILVFMLLGFKFPVKNQTLLLLIAAFFLLPVFGGMIWANLIGIVFFALFSYLFISSGIKTLKYWFSDNP